MSFGLIDAFLGINIQILCFKYVKKCFFVIILLELFLISFLFLIIFINFAGKISRGHLTALIIVHCKLLIIHYIVLWKRLR